MYSIGNLLLTLALLLCFGLIAYVSISQYIQHERAIENSLQKIRQDITIGNRLKLSRIQLNRCRLEKCRRNLQTKKPYRFIESDKPNHKENEDNEEEENGILFIED